MVWDHEVPGSNPGTPTTHLSPTGRLSSYAGDRLARPPRRTLLLAVPLTVILVGIVGWVVVAGLLSPAPVKLSKTDATATAKEALRALPTRTPMAMIADPSDAVPPQSSVYVPNVTMPVSMVFTPDGRMLF